MVAGWAGMRVAAMAKPTLTGIPYHPDETSASLRVVRREGSSSDAGSHPYMQYEWFARE
jgi:hypothetical protein